MTTLRLFDDFGNPLPPAPTQTLPPELNEYLGKYAADNVTPPDVGGAMEAWGKYGGGTTPSNNPQEPLDPTALGPTSERGATDIRSMQDFVAAGGPNDWEAFRMHMLAAGMGDPGEQPASGGAIGMPGSQDRGQLSGGAFGIPQGAVLPQAPVAQPPGAPSPDQTQVQIANAAGVLPENSAVSPSSAPAPVLPTATAAAPATQVAPVGPAKPAAAPAQQPESRREVWFLPDGRMVAATPGTKPPAGTSSVQLTDTQIRNIQKTGREQPVVKTDAPLDPGKSLATPSAGQLAVDSVTVPTVNTPLGAYVNSKPLEGLAAMYVRRQAGAQAPPEIVAQAAANNVKGMAQALGKGDPNTVAYLKDIARIAWYRQVGGQVNGQSVTPEMAPNEYVESWMGSWRTGRMVPMGAALDQQLIDNGIVPPSAKELTNKVSVTAAQILSDPGKALAPVGRAYANAQAAIRVSQGDRGGYAGYTDAEYQTWSQVACGAASFSAMLKSATGKDMPVGESVAFLRSKGLLSSSQGLLRGSDFTDIAKTLNEAAGEEVAFAVNYRSPDAVRKHFADGGGAIMFTGPGAGAAWSFTHIYVATGVDENGITIIDSSNRNKTHLTWDEWRGQTALPGAGAGAALFSRRNEAVTGSGLSPGTTRTEAIQAGGGALITTGTDQVGSTRAKEEGAGDPGRPSSEGGQGGFRALPTGAEFIPAAIPHVQRASQQTGLAPELILAIAINENGRTNDSALGREHNNYFGMKADPSWTDRGRQTVTMRTREERADGSSYWEENAQWRHYDDPAEGFTGLGDFLRRNERYTRFGVFETSDPYEQVQRMKNAGYATDNDWVRQVHAIMNQIKPYFQ